MSVACGIPSVRFEEATKDKFVADVLECAKTFQLNMECLLYKKDFLNLCRIMIYNWDSVPKHKL